MEQIILVDNSPFNLPAPVWFVQFFKWLGFTLHAVPMGLWYAGLLIALILHIVGNEYGRRFAGRLMRQMPVIVAFGINLGIVPLLFVQLAYSRFFYPATILIAWFWLAVIGLLVPAYYGVYAYAWRVRDEEGQKRPAGLALGAGWIAALFFIIIGFLFTNGMSLIDHVFRWHELWKNNSYAGATSGLALNITDPTLWPRWILMVGLSLCTTAAWVVVDAFLPFAKQPDESYKDWAFKFARKLYTTGLIVTFLAGTWYVFGSWSRELRSEMFGWPLAPLTLLTGMATGLPWLLLFFGQRFFSQPVVAGCVGLGQLGVLGINAISRQVVQNINIRLYTGVDILAQPTKTEWGPLLMFLIVFVAGLVVLAWMIRKILVFSTPGEKILSTTERDSV